MKSGPAGRTSVPVGLGRWPPHSRVIGTQSGEPVTNPLHGVNEHPWLADETKQVFPGTAGTSTCPIPGKAHW